jgi:hypothetical protein
LVVASRLKNWPLTPQAKTHCKPRANTAHATPPWPQPQQEWGGGRSKMIRPILASMQNSQNSNTAPVSAIKYNMASKDNDSAFESKLQPFTRHEWIGKNYFKKVIQIHVVRARYSGPESFFAVEDDRFNIASGPC